LYDFTKKAGKFTTNLNVVFSTFHHLVRVTSHLIKFRIFTIPVSNVILHSSSVKLHLFHEGKLTFENRYRENTELYE
ncbi:hypothetical protein L9F63_013219, partial [Diploptera punctata]